MVDLITCECHVEGLHVVKLDIEEYHDIEISLWGMNGSYLSFKERIKEAFTILTGGTFYSGWIVLSPENARRLGEKLLLASLPTAPQD